MVNWNHLRWGRYARRGVRKAPAVFAVRRVRRGKMVCHRVAPAQGRTGEKAGELKSSSAFSQSTRPVMFAMLLVEADRLLEPLA